MFLTLLFNSRVHRYSVILAKRCLLQTEHNSRCRYTSGEVKFWNTGNAEQCLFQASCRALEINEYEDAGTSTNYVTCVRTNHNVTAAGYSQGKGSFILERKRKRHHFQPVALFPICVFILQQQQQRQRSKKKVAFALI